MQGRSGRSVWVWWVLTTTLAATAGLVISDAFVLGLPAPAFAGDNGIYPLTLWSCGLLLIAAPLVGITQALVLKRFTGLRMLGPCVVSTILGVLAAMLTNLMVNIVIFMGAGLLLPGTVIGFAQWLVLRRDVEG